MKQLSKQIEKETRSSYIKEKRNLVGPNWNEVNREVYFRCGLFGFCL